MKLYISYFLSFVLTYCFCQKNELSLQANYTFSNSISGRLFEIKATLVANKAMSLYTVIPYGKHSNDNIESTFNEDNGLHTITNIKTSDNNITITRDVASNLLLHNSTYLGKSNVKEFIPDFNWKLTSEKKKINNFNAFKATTQFRGRNYIAWYILDIPIPVGPWKFSGLPGLIIDIYDETQNFRWSLKSLKYPVKFDVPIQSPLEGKKDIVSLREHIENQDSRLNKTNKIRNSKLPGVMKSKLVSSERQGIELIYEWETQGKESVIKN